MRININKYDPLHETFYVILPKNLRKKCKKTIF